MPQIKIKRGGQTSSSSPTLDDGELYLSNGGAGEGKLYAGTSDGDTNTDKVRVKYSDNSTYASKVGNENSHPGIGFDNDDSGQGSSPKGLNPVYVDESGAIVGATRTHGSPTQPVYVNEGKIVPSNGNVGGDDRDTGLKPIFMVGGVFTAAHRSHGSSTVPVYVSNGSIVEGDTYAGGTKVTVNGTPYAGQSVSLYAPVSAPSGYDKRLCAWKNSNGRAEFITDTIGSNSKPIYLSGGVPTAMSSNIGGNTKPVYISSGAITASNATVGDSTTPMYMSSGSLTACSPYAGATRCTFGGSYSSTHAFFEVIESWGMDGDDYKYDYSPSSDVANGIYLVIARDTESAKNLYTFYVAVDRNYMTYANSLCYSSSFATQPISGNPHSCRVRVQKYGTYGLTFLLEDDASLEWRFVKIIRISSF